MVPCTLCRAQSLRSIADMVFSFLADVIIGLHLGFLVFTLIGQLLIFVGIALKWNWVRNPWFRCVHLACILFVALEYTVSMECPLTVLERQVRALGGEAASDASFIARLMESLFFYSDLE